MRHISQSKLISTIQSIWYQLWFDEFVSSFLFSILFSVEWGRSIWAFRWCNRNNGAIASDRLRSIHYTTVNLRNLMKASGTLQKWSKKLPKNCKDSINPFERFHSQFWLSLAFRFIMNDWNQLTRIHWSNPVYKISQTCLFQIYPIDDHKWQLANNKFVKTCVTK